MKTDRTENIKFIVTNYKDSFTSLIAIIIRICFLLDCRLLFLRFLLLTLSMCLFAGCSTKTIVILILKYLASKLTVEIVLLYQQLVACLRLCSSVFWCFANMSLFTAMFLLLRFLF